MAALVRSVLDTRHDQMFPRLEPAELDRLVAYLAGPEAGFVTGASLLIDGGFTA